MAGAIRTSPQNAAYDEGWERAFAKPRRDREDVWREVNRRFAEWAGHPLGGRKDDGAGDREPRVSDPKGNTEPEAEQAAPRPREHTSRGATPYACPTCGWHLAYSSEKCGNATCPRGKTYYTTRS